MEKIPKQLITKKNTQNGANSGITLIALTITIIVLLILAGVSIAMLTEDNGKNRDNKTTRDETISTIVEQEKKQIDSTYHEIIKDKNINTTNISDIDITVDELREKFDQRKVTVVKSETESNIFVVTFIENKNVYMLDVKKGTIEGPIENNNMDVTD